MLYADQSPFKAGDTVRVESPANVGIPIDQRIGKVTEIKITERDFNLVTFRYNDGDEVMIEDFSKKYKIGDRYTGIGLSTIGQPTVVKIESYTRYYRHVMVKNSNTGEVTQESEAQLLKWYL